MRTRREGGLVLVSVLFFVLLLVAAVATFLRQAGVDSLVARNRDRAAQAYALARGGIDLGVGLLLEDRLAETQDLRVETRQDLWARAGEEAIVLPDGGELRLRIEDAGARLNLNALFEEGAPRDELTEPFLATLLDKVILEMEEAGLAEHPYDALALARSLIDWVDADDLRVLGGPEDAYYQEQVPPYRAANRPLLSFDELLLVEGFDRPLVDALRPYAGVHPVAGSDGINPNTAPSWVLAALYHGTAGDYRLASEDVVRDLLDIRAEGGILCAESANTEGCTPLLEVVAGEVYPPPSYTSEIFRVTSEARYGPIRRTVEAIVDRGDLQAPRILAWDVR